MELRAKRKMIEQMATGQLTVAEVKKKVVYFLLPANDGSDDVKVMTGFGSRTYTREQYLKTSYAKHWQPMQKQPNTNIELKRAMLEAMQTGGIEKIARPLPEVWCKRFGPNELLN